MVAAQGARLSASVVTVGTFDGLHLGHQALLRAVHESAGHRGAEAVVVTFDPPPRMVLRPDPSYKLLISLRERLELLKRYGADQVEVMRFDDALSKVPAEDFTRDLVERLGMIELIGGPDLAVGHRRQGTPDVLTAIGKRLGFEVRVVPPFTLDGQPVRSGQVRELIRAGDVAGAARLLGRAPTVEGEVVPGDGRGRTIGVPTANLAIAEGRLVPGNGVYAARTSGWHTRGKVSNASNVSNSRAAEAVVNIGTRPTVDGRTRTVEAHILDFEGDLYGQTLNLQLIARLRDEQRFGSLDQLVAQIRRDVEAARRILQTSAA